MSWHDTLSLIVRNLIGDMSDTPTYTDDRIQQAIATAGLIAAQEYEFDTDYTFDIGTPDISPDPTEVATLDPIAMALFSLKAACLLNMNSYQGAVGTAIEVKDGDSSVSTVGSFQGYRDILKLGPCASYEKLLKQKSFLSSMKKGKAISSPFIHESFLISGTFTTQQFFDSFLLR